MIRFIIFCILSLTLTAQSNKFQLLPKPGNKHVSQNSTNCNLEKTEEDKMYCRAKGEAIRVIKTMKLRFALASKDSITMTANSFCEDGKREQCIRQATHSASQERLKAGKAFTRLYQPIVALILEAGKNVTERRIPQKQADQYLSERILEAYNEALHSNKKVSSQNKPKNEVVGSKNLQKTNQRTEKRTDIKPSKNDNKTGLVKRFIGSVLISALKTVTLHGATFAATALTNLLAAAKMLLQFIWSKALQLLTKATALLKSLPSLLGKLVRPVSQWSFSAIKSRFTPVLTGLKNEVWSAVKTYLFESWMYDPRYSPITTLVHGLGLGYEPESFEDAEKECLKQDQEIYDEETNYTWYFKCEYNSYYRLDSESKSLVLYTDDPALCTSSTLYSCQNPI
jgi:hypothetical protein